MALILNLNLHLPLSLGLLLTRVSRVEILINRTATPDHSDCHPDRASVSERAEGPLPVTPQSEFRYRKP